MKTWKLALVGLATLSTSAFAVPVTNGSAVAAKTETVISVPDLGGDEIVIVTNKVTGEVSVQAADGSLVPTKEVSVAEMQKVCYGGPCGLSYGNGYLGYGGGYPVAPPVVVQEEEFVKIRRFRRSTVVPGYDVGPGYGYGGPGYGGPVGPGYGPGPGYEGY